MTGLLFLLGEMGLLLLLAAIAGWFLGWSSRGFRERDRFEDLQRTLRATEEVKDRDLTEMHQKASSLESQLEQQQRRAERLEGEVQELRASASSPRPAEDPEAVETVRFIPPASLAEVGELHERLADAEARLDEETARRREAEAALRDKTAAVLALQAEAQALREAASERGAELARLEARVVELEGPQASSEVARIAEQQQEISSLRHRLDEANADLETASRDLQAARSELDARDRRINELRVRYQDAAAAFEEERSRLQEAQVEASAVQDHEELLELRRLLQRQVERNRKLEAVHRAVVSNLQAELDEAHGKGARPTPATEPRPAGGNGASDDLTRIHGIGPRLATRLAELGITRFAQIAAWNEDDIERLTHELGDLTDRIRRDGWVEGAREQLRAKYGSLPWS